MWNAHVPLRELRARGFSGGHTILKVWLHSQRISAQAVAVRRFETAPGEQAQVDRGEGVRSRSCGLPAQALQ
jgi:transposase